MKAYARIMGALVVAASASVTGLVGCGGDESSNATSTTTGGQGGDSATSSNGSNGTGAGTTGTGGAASTGTGTGTTTTGTGTATTGTGTATSTSTGPDPCAPEPGDDPCRTCAKVHCCTEALACFADTQCTCLVDCYQNPPPGDPMMACFDSCNVLPPGGPGPTQATQDFGACASSNCQNECGF